MSRFISSHPEHQLYEDHKLLFPRTVMPTAAGYGSLADMVQLPSTTRALLLTLQVTAAAAGVGDTLDAVVSTRIYYNGVAAWIEVCAFPQVLGNGGALVHIDKLVVDLDQAAFQNAALAAGAKRHIFGDAWVAGVTTAGGTAVFTASIDIMPMG